MLKPEDIKRILEDGKRYEAMRSKAWPWYGQLAALIVLCLVLCALGWSPQ